MSNKFTSNKSETTWEQLFDEDIAPSNRPAKKPDKVAQTSTRRSPKQQPAQKLVLVTIDQDVLEWFEAQGDDSERQMALALRIYAEANKAYANKSAPT
ncbi:MAG: BrnA antitoxin family protein [Leptolyngbyaceae cyanobacterium MAG.088]|nr:BrnA antitoxin family protein [Leptolyngbyaceae cyanobacterium MAG.088]